MKFTSPVNSIKENKLKDSKGSSIGKRLSDYQSPCKVASFVATNESSKSICTSQNLLDKPSIMNSIRSRSSRYSDMHGNFY